jgi:hypothetical protein
MEQNSAVFPHSCPIRRLMFFQTVLLSFFKVGQYSSYYKIDCLSYPSFFLNLSQTEENNKQWNQTSEWID